MGYITLKGHIQSSEYIENVCRAAEFLRDIPMINEVSFEDDGDVRISVSSDWFFDNLPMDAERDGNYLVKRLDPKTAVRRYREAEDDDEQREKEVV